jgi:hypothetical protein
MTFLLNNETEFATYREAYAIIDPYIEELRGDDILLDNGTIATITAAGTVYQILPDWIKNQACFEGLTAAGNIPIADAEQFYTSDNEDVRWLVSKLLIDVGFTLPADITYAQIFTEILPFELFMEWLTS